MTSIERTTYPRFKGTLSDKEAERLFRPTEEEKQFVRARAETNDGRLALLVLLKCHQYLGYLPVLADVPPGITQYLRGELCLPADTRPRQASRQARQRHRALVHSYLRIKPYAQGGREVVSGIIRVSAHTMSDPADLVNAAIEQLIQKRIELPAYSTLVLLAASIRKEVHEKIYARVTASLSSGDARSLEALLHVPSRESSSAFSRLKEPPGRPTLSEMRRWVERLDWLDTILSVDTATLLAEVAHTKRRQFAAEARALELGDMRDIRNTGKRLTLLVSLVHQARSRVRDDLTTMFLKRIRRVRSLAKLKLEELRDEHRDVEERMVAALSQIAGMATSTTTDGALGQEVRCILATLGGAEQVEAQYRQVSAYHNNNYLPLVWSTYRAHRAALLRLVGLLRVEPATQDVSLAEALNFVLHSQAMRRDHVPSDSIDLSFASERWRAQIELKVESQVVLDRRQLEVCVLIYLARALQNGDVYVPGSESFADYRAQLLPWAQCEGRLISYCEGVGLAVDARSFTRELNEKLARTIERVDEGYSKNEDLLIDADGHAHLKRLRALPPPPGAKELLRKVRERMPERHLLDILRDVHHWTSYIRHFGPLSGSDPKLREPLRQYLFTIFALGCGLGSSQTARHSLGEITARVIDRVNKQHVTSPVLEAALRDIIAKYKMLQLPRAWGSGEAAIADGTHVELRENNLLGEQHIRYGAYGGIAYHHISDTYVALFSHFIACGVWEAVYVLDGLLKNASEIQPDTVHADTQGQSEPVFGLAYLLGIKLMPRMRTWNDVSFYRPGRSNTYKHLGPILTRVVDWGLIEAHWKDMMQVVLSVQAGKVMPSMLLQKLGTYSQQSTLYRSFQELGRVSRTLYLLEYISNSQLRRRVDTATTKIESFNAFSDWVSFGGEAVTSDDPVEQEKRIKYTTLVANAAMLSNVVDLTNALVQLAAEGHPLDGALLSLLSPYMTAHIKRFGHFVVDTETKPAPFDPVELSIAA